VAPGFEFTDFELLRDAAAAERSAIELHPELLEFV
jgi:predicted cupin superfamily sugar epimerase